MSMIGLAIVLAAASGLPGLFMSRKSALGQWIAVALMCCASAAGILGACSGFREGLDAWIGFPWQAVGGSTVGLDALSAFFLIPVFLMGGLGSVYGLGYWPQIRNPRSGRKLRLFWGLLVAGLAILVVGRHAMAFLFGWEVMALSAFFLVTLDDHRAECRRAGWYYLLATHIGTLALFAMFSLWRWATGSFALQPAACEPLSLGVMNGLFVLALIGFGVKAGVMPLHFWLPAAHANAPSHVSAMLSGVVLKMGIYGLLRILTLLPGLPGVWGGLVLLLGAASGLLGVVFAIGQHDLKRLLAYHSIENIGIILMGLGIAMLGRSAGRPECIVLGLAGCLLHVWNHGLFKALLFLCAGSVVHAARTRRIDHLGGLAKSMPWTAALFLVGAVAICGLPPLNGFVSEWLVYLGLFRLGIGDGAGGSAAMLAAPVLAMIGALAVACFVKVYGAVFLGTARTRASAKAHESPATMRAPMLALAACCVLIGLAPILVTPILESVVANWMSAPLSATPSLPSAAPLGVVGFASASLAAFILLLAFLLVKRSEARGRAGTWDCGYASASSRIQYTAASFARTIVLLFGWVLRPRVHPPRVEGPFPRPTGMHSHVDDAVLDRLLVPVGIAFERWFGWFRRFQQGLTQHYVLYILITVTLMLSTLIPFGEIVTRLFAR